MDELEISGKRYISTRRAAREHGYHSDYMGQLIRGKKVAGQKVGRAWYIEEESLDRYLGKAPAPAPVQQEAPVQVAAVEPVPVVLEPIAAKIVEEIKEVEETEVAAEPIVIHTEREIAEPIQVQSVVQEIHHAPYVPAVEENERRIPIHALAPTAEETGGLRYADDTSSSIPVVTRMPVREEVERHSHTPIHEALHAHGTHTRQFPYLSLAALAVLTIAATAFVSNFVSATIVSEAGKEASVGYVIHW